MVIAPIAIVFLLAGIAAIAAPSSQCRADAYRVVEAILQIRFLAGGDRKKIDPRWVSSTVSVPVSNFPAVENFARAVELVGALVTAIGLSYAYGRAKYGERFLVEFWDAVVDRMMRRPRAATVHVSAAIGATGTFSADAYAVFQLDKTAPTEAQLNQLADFCRSTQTELAKVRQQLAQHDRDISGARTHATEVAAQAHADAVAHLNGFESRLNNASSLDLRWAILGLLINSFGVALGFWGG